MYKSFFAITIITLLQGGCKQPKALDAQTIVDRAIAVSGGETIEKASIAFDFRNWHYKAIRNHGVFQLERQFKDSLDIIRDVLSNDGFQRYKNDSPIKVSDTMAPKYARSVNSVHYFSVLPYGLNDAAVNKTYLNEVSINAQPYHKIKVTFNQNGGGDDFEDVFTYWINANTFKTDYLAYSYLEDDGEFGLRFREAFNERFINGIRFVDYNNFKPKDLSAALENLDVLFENDGLQLLSKIELENISVN